MAGLTTNHCLLDNAGTNRGSFLALIASKDRAIKQNKVRNSPTIWKPKKRFELGTKTPNLLLQNELRRQAVRSMAEPTELNSDDLKKRNTIITLSRPEAAELPEALQIFTALQKAHFVQALKCVINVFPRIVAGRSTANSNGSSFLESTTQGCSTAAEPSSTSTNTL